MFTEILENEDEFFFVLNSEERREMNQCAFEEDDGKDVNTTSSRRANIMFVHEHIQNITNMLLHGQHMAMQRSDWWESFEKQEIDAIETEIDSIERRYHVDFIGVFLLRLSLFRPIRLPSITL